MGTQGTRAAREHVGSPVAMIHWPRDQDRREQAARHGIPRLLLVEADAPTPSVGDDEDWIRLPADERDVAARLDGLRARTAAVRLDDAVLRTPGGVATLSAAEAAVVASLLDHPDTLVPRAELEAALAGHVTVTPRTLEGAVYRVRRRLRPVGLDVFASRGRGYILGPRLDWPDDALLP